MSKHTPGPWHYRPNTAHSWPLVVIGGSDDDSARGVSINSAHGRDGVTPMEELNANARLIAAAPDLLAVLKALVASNGDCWCAVQYEQGVGLLGLCELHGALQAASDAIAKAEGES